MSDWQVHRHGSKERQQAAQARVDAAEARRTPRDRNYARQVDALIGHAVRAANKEMGTPPPRRDVARHAGWDQAWSRAFHAAMDALCLARGVRTQSHQT